MLQQTRQKVVDLVVNKGVVVWLAIAIVLVTLVATEIAGLTLKGWHTISYVAQRNPLVFWLVTAAGVVFLAFWFDHIFLSGVIPK